jgi:hypothetical protein
MAIAAFLIGFTGSLHCIGMCGPIAMQVKGHGGFSGLVNRVAYHSGRIITYSLLGLLVGALGELMAITGWQGWLSIALGMLILLAVFFRAIQQRWQPALVGYWSTLKSYFSKYLKMKDAGSGLLLGIMNGLLPCGLVYAAMVLALVQTHWWQSVEVMLLFGVGTIPGLVGITYVAHRVINRFPFSIQRVQTALVVTMALVMIWRGISLAGLFHIQDTVLCYPMN